MESVEGQGNEVGNGRDGAERRWGRTKNVGRGCAPVDCGRGTARRADIAGTLAPRRAERARLGDPCLGERAEVPDVRPCGAVVPEGDRESAQSAEGDTDGGHVAATRPAGKLVR